MISTEDLLINKPLLDVIFQKAKDSKLINKIYLVNSIKLEASLVDFDRKHILISGKDNGMTLVYLHSVASFTQTDYPANTYELERSEHGSLEEDFFNACDKYETINVYLVNGIKLTGRITAFDNECLLMTSTYNNRESAQVIMKSAIASVSPN